jgi:hypothetical protein
MKSIEVSKRQLDLKQYKKREALEDDVSHLVNYDCMITEGGIPKILYLKLPEAVDTQSLRWAVMNVKYGTQKRTAGLLSQSKVFGYLPRRVLIQDFCSTAAMAEREPKQHFIITKFAEQLAKVYQQYFPQVYDQHMQITLDKIKRDYIIGDTPFTSGIVNKNNQLKYHHDGGNFKDVLSNMIVFKNGVSGGRLVCPEYDMKFEVEDNTIIIFDGQKILHGVTKIEYRHPRAYRYSVVYYSMNQLWKCDGINEELGRIRKVKQSREKKRILAQQEHASRGADVLGERAE